MNLAECKIFLAKVNLVYIENEVRPIIIGYKKSQYTGFFQVQYYIVRNGKVEELDVKTVEDLSYNVNLQNGRENYFIPTANKWSKQLSIRLMDENKIKLIKLEYELKDS